MTALDFQLPDRAGDQAWGPMSLQFEGGASGTLSDQATALIHGELVAGRLKPGQRLKPDELKARYQIGSSPIREALMRLSVVGLVQMEGNRGFSVAPASMAELVDVADIRAELSCMALRRAITRGGDAWEASIVAAFHMMERIKQATIDDPEKNFDAWEQRNKAFHNALEAGCGSPWLLHFCAVAFSQSERYRRGFVTHYPMIIPEAQEEHRVIMDAAISRDAEAAVKALRTHIHRGMTLVQQAMAASVD
jgi:GntR family transcriptional regulator, carbon starvation induced regulator